MKMENKIIIGLLLLLQAYGVTAKGEGMGSYDSYNPAWQQKLAEIKLDDAYAEYVKGINDYNNKQIAQADAHQREYIKQHPNQPLPTITIAEIAPIPKAAWMEAHEIKTRSHETDSQLRTEYNAYVKANANPYASLYQQREAKLKQLHSELATLKKKDSTNHQKIRELQEMIESWNTYDPAGIPTIQVATNN